MFKNFRLGTKIGVGFGVVLILLGLVLGEGIMALQRTEKGIEEYRSLARDTNLSGQLQANMLMVRMNVKDFLITKSDRDLQQYEAYISKMKTFLAESKQEIQQPDRASLIAEIDREIADYQNAFDQVVQLNNERNKVDETHLVPNGDKMRTTIDGIIESAYQDGDVEAAYYAGLVQEKMLVGRLYVVKFLQTNLLSDFDVAVENMEKSLKEEMRILDTSLQNPKRRDLYQEFARAHEDYLMAMTDIRDLIVKRNDIIENTLDVIGVRVAKEAEDVKLSVMKDQDALGSALKARTEKSIFFTFTLSAIAIVLGIFAAYLLTITITRPIRKAVEAANQLANGDLTIEVTSNTQDETGKLLTAVQDTATHLKQMITTISSASIELASASEELATVTEQTSKGIERQETETEMVAAAMNEMATTVHDVANSASKASDAATQADQEAKTGGVVIEQTISSINSLSASVNHSSLKLDEVQQEVMNISTILEVIREIAEQTNLLALNAAIEAARAGEQGRGFAVVADEVRSLAERTQGSTSEIQSIIEQLQTGTKNTVEAMNEGKVQAENCVEQATGASTALQAITHAISVISDMNMQIASAAEQQSIVAEDINKNVVNVKHVAEVNAVAANETSSSSNEIARLAGELGQLVAKFKVS